MHDTAAQVDRALLKSNASSLLVDKGNHRHFMAKEIFEQPEVVGQRWRTISTFGRARAHAGSELRFCQDDRIAISACGTAFYAGLTAKYWFERCARIPVEVDVASEFRYREAPLRRVASHLVLQSGETADTLAALRYAKEQKASAGGCERAGVDHCPRERRRFSDAGRPEIGVASTKAFTCQLAALCCLAIEAGGRGASREDDERSWSVR